MVEAMTPKEQELMTSFLKLVMNYLQSNPLTEDVLVDYHDYESLEKKFDTFIGQEGILEEELLASVQSYMKYCVRTFHPQFWGKLYAGYNIPGLIGEILSNVTNTSMATYVASPVATLIENELIKKMTEASSYVFHDLGGKAYDLGEKSLQCTRKVDTLKLWFVWKYYGDEGYERRFDQVFNLAQYAEQKIKGSPFLELIFPRQFVNLCFRYKPTGEEDVQQFNRMLQKQLIERGKTYINYAQVKGLMVLRLNVINPGVEKEDIDHLLDCVIEVGQELER
jgi:glutamate/tyrosine decarboxylase-like PLP-dependent enzyme